MDIPSHEPGQDAVAIYHLTTKLISRANGHSAVAAAAYRAGDRLHDERREQTQDYRRRSGVISAQILAPQQAAAWMCERETLWNACEMLETRKNSRTAREIEVALPRELDEKANQTLVQNFVKDAFVSEGMVADVAIHDAPARDGGRNIHAHILLSTRPVLHDGSGFGKKNRWWDSKDALASWRHSWEQHVNEALADSGEEARIDRRSLEAQGIARLPEPKIGSPARALEAQGIESERGAFWREVLHRNRLGDAILLDNDEIALMLAAAAKMTQAQSHTHQLLSLASQALGARGQGG